jgi:hypothetical protein
VVSLGLEFLGKDKNSGFMGYRLRREIISGRVIVVVAKGFCIGRRSDFIRTPVVLR